MKRRFGCLLSLLAACGESPPAVIGGYYEPVQDWRQEPQPLPGSAARGPACSFYPCVDVCGQRIAIAPVEPAFGFEEAGSPSWLLSTGHPLSGDRLLTVNLHGAEILDAGDFTVLGRVPVASAYEAAAVGDVALVQSRGALELLDVGPAPRVRARWFLVTPSERPTLSLLGARAGHFLLRTSSGIAFVEVVGTEPRQVACFSPPPEREWWYTVLTGNTFAIAESAVGQEPEIARLYTVTEAGLVDGGSVPMEREGPIGGADGRISVTWRGERLAVHELTSEGPVEVGSVPGVFPPSDIPSSGGFEFFQTWEGGPQAVDLRDSFEFQIVEPVADAPCLLRVQSRSSPTAYIVSPLWPDARLPAQPVPSVDCPARSEPYYDATGVLSPDGARLLARAPDGNSWVIRDLASGTEQAGPDVPDEHPVYWGEDRVVLVSTSGGDWGLTTQSTLTVVSTVAPYPALATLGTPGPVIDVQATATDVWALSYASNFDYEDSPPAARLLLRLDPHLNPIQAVVMRELSRSASQLAVFGDRAYVLSGTSLEVVARDGTSLQTLTLPSAAPDVAASELGFFTSDGQQLSWLAPGASAPTRIECNGCRVHGADSSRVYATAHAPSDARHPTQRSNDELLGYTELRAYQPSSGALLGRYPLPAAPRKLLQGAGRLVALSASETVSVLAPPPLP